MADDGSVFQNSSHQKQGYNKNADDQWGAVYKQQSSWSKVDETDNTHDQLTYTEAALTERGTKRRSKEHEEDQPEKKKASVGFSIGQKPSNLNVSSGATSGGSLSLMVKKSPVTPVSPIKMSLGTQKPKSEPVPLKKKSSAAVAQAFAESSDESDPEEMPPEAKMRMRNIGRDTPTAAGPNSYGKGRLGFCDRQKIIERQLKKVVDK
ncbi:PEST proteolytic signal-containing nuclear protein-like [Lineus longissimus]|uniref:PEST proteolytic signal-containing nuclear protein-like n=1 Tax=Lineus longissimus TaxID=88925 RepID=UPI00315CC897